GIRGAVGAILDPTAGRVNGVGLLRGMKPFLVSRGVSIFEGSPAIAIEEGRETKITTAAGEIRARAVVLATNAYGRQLGYFGAGILPLQSHVLATAPISDAQWQSIGWGNYDGFSDDRDRVAYGCR